MSPNAVLIISGPPGAGKSSVTELVADHFDSVICMHYDRFLPMVHKGFVEPRLPRADAQNRTLIRACAAVAAASALGGYPVVLEGVLGPWFLGLIVETLWRDGVEDLHYFVLDSGARSGDLAAGPRRECGASRACRRSTDPPVVERLF